VDGSIVLVGRRDDQVKIRGYRVDLSEVTAALHQLDGVTSGVALNVGDDQGARICAFVTLADAAPAGPARDLRTRLSALLASHALPEDILVLPALPLLPNGKIDRQALLRAHQAQSSGPETAAQATLQTTEDRLLHAFRTLLRSKRVTLDSSFESLGGDSLSYVTVYLALEELLGEVPPQWTSLSVRELGGLTRKAGGGLFTKIESSMLLRAASISAIVADHYHIIKFPGTTSVLMFVSGLMFGNIQIKEIAKSGASLPIIRFIRRMLVQYFVLLAPFIARTFVQGGPAWAALFLISDIVNWKSGLAHKSEIFWYIHCLFHILLAYAAIYAVARRFRSGQDAAILTLFVCCGVGLIGRDVAPYLFGLRFHAEAGHDYTPFHHLPTSHIATFALAALSTTVTGVRKLLLAGVFAGYALAGLSAYGPVATTFLTVGGLWIMFLPKMPVPKLVAPLLYNVAGASMFIYLLHNPLKDVTDHFGKVPAVLECAAAIAASVAAWRLWNLGAQVLPRLLARLAAWRPLRGGLNLARPIS
jgi:hypothetical protein